jgi:hypothetical protein
MLPKNKNEIKKGMVFAGCSFTWGQGLYYYSNLNTLKEPAPDTFDPTLLTRAQIKYMESVRFPRTVSRKLKSYEFVYPGNGGSNEGVVKWWETCIYRGRYHTDVMNDYKIPIMYPSEISHFIFQFTQWNREHVWLDDLAEGHDIEFNRVYDPAYRDLFLKKLFNEKLTIDQFIENHIEKSFDRVKNLLTELESDGVKILILTWPDEYLKYIKNDEWANDKLVHLEYKNEKYESIHQLMNSRNPDNSLSNPEMTIKYDSDSFIDPPKDHHPSMKCHNIIAGSIIKKIEDLV